MADLYAHQYPDESAYTSRGCPWVAECTVDGVPYAARSRSGAPYALARVPDAPMVLISQGLKGETRYRSFHEMAGYTIVENATHSVHRARWVPYEERVAVAVAPSSPGLGQNRGSSDAPAISAALVD